MEPFGDGADGALVEDGAVDGDGELEGLPAIAEVDRVGEVALARRDAVAGQLRLGLLAHRGGEIREDRRGIRIQPADGRAGEGVDDIRLQNAARGQGAGIDREDDAADRKFLRDRTGMDRAGATEAQQREIARIEPLFEQAHADRGGQIGIGDAENAGRRGIRPEPERHGDMSVDGPARGQVVEPHLATEEMRAVEAAERKVGIRHRRFGAALAVADGARHGARALGADAQGLSGTDTGDGPAAGADRPDLDHRHADGQAVDLALGDDFQSVVAHEGDVVAGAAHVDADEVGLGECAGERERRHRAAAGAGQQQSDRLGASDGR